MFFFVHSRNLSVSEDELLPVGCWPPPASWLGPGPGSSQLDPRRWTQWPAPSCALCGRTSRWLRVKENQYKDTASPEDGTFSTTWQFPPQAQSKNIQCLDWEFHKKTRLWKQAVGVSQAGRQPPKLMLPTAAVVWAVVFIEGTKQTLSKSNPKVLSLFSAPPPMTWTVLSQVVPELAQCQFSLCTNHVTSWLSSLISHSRFCIKFL